MTTYFAIRHIEEKIFWHPYGVSAAPHLYLTRGKAEARRKQLWPKEAHEVVEVTLTVKE